MKRALIVLFIVLMLVPLISAQKHANLIVYEDGSGEFRFNQQEGLTCAKGLKTIDISLASIDDKQVYTKSLSARLNSFDLTSFDLVYLYAEDMLNYSGSASFENNYIYDFAESTINYAEGDLSVVSTFRGLIRESSTIGSQENLTTALNTALATCEDVNGVVSIYDKTDERVLFSVNITNYSKLFDSECSKAYYNLRNLKSASVVGFVVPESTEAYATARIEKQGSNVGIVFSGTAKEPNFSYDDLSIYTNATYSTSSKELLVTSSMTSASMVANDTIANQFSFYPAISGASLNVICQRDEDLNLTLKFNDEMFNDRRTMDMSPIGSMTVGNDVIRIFNSQVLIPESATRASFNYLEIFKSYYSLPLTFVTGTLIVGISKPVELFTVTLAPRFDLMNYTIEPTYKEPGYYEWQKPRSLYFVVTPSELKPSIVEPVMLVIAIVLLIGLVAFGIKLIFAQVKGDKPKGDIK